MKVIDNKILTIGCVFSHIKFQHFCYRLIFIQNYRIKAYIFADKIFKFIWRNLAQSLKTGNLRICPDRLYRLFALRLRITIKSLLLIANPEKRCLQNVQMTLLNQFGEEL